MDVRYYKGGITSTKRLNLLGDLYYKTQIVFAYNRNHMEGWTILLDETKNI